jgi:hypothetical protein
MSLLVEVCADVERTHRATAKLEESVRHGVRIVTTESPGGQAAEGRVAPCVIESSLSASLDRHYQADKLRKDASRLTSDAPIEEAIALLEV